MCWRAGATILWWSWLYLPVRDLWILLLASILSTIVFSPFIVFIEKEEKIHMFTRSIWDKIWKTTWSFYGADTFKGGGMGHRCNLLNLDVILRSHCCMEMHTYRQFCAVWVGEMLPYVLVHFFCFYFSVHSNNLKVVICKYVPWYKKCIKCTAALGHFGPPC